MSRWIKADLTQQAAAPPAAGDPIAYVTHLEGHDTARVIHSGPEAHIHELRLESGGPWKGADLTDQAGGPGCRDRPMAYLTTFDSVQVARIVYLGTDSHIHELRLEPGARWKKADLTDLAGASGANGAPFGYVTPFDSGGTARVVYPGADGHIHELRLEPGQSWQKADLTDQTGAPGARGAPFAYLTPLNSQGTARVLYAGADGHIHELRLEQGGTWQAADLSAQAQGPNAAGRPAAYLTRFSGAPTARVLYRADDGHVHELRLEPGSSWKHADLTDGANGEAASSDPVGYVTPPIPSRPLGSSISVGTPTCMSCGSRRVDRGRPRT
jgi:hypothetical protein